MYRHFKLAPPFIELPAFPPVTFLPAPVAIPAIRTMPLDPPAVPPPTAATAGTTGYC